MQKKIGSNIFDIGTYIHILYVLKKRLNILQLQTIYTYVYR